MIAPEFRQCAAINLKDPAKKFIETNHGSELFTSLSPALEEVEAIKKELCGAQQYKCDPEQLKKFTELFAKNYQNSMLLNKYFSFGTGNQQIAVKFQWMDAFSQQKIESYSPLFDALSSKYNLGVSLARQACYMNLEGDGIKYASKFLQQAAWIFEDLQTNVTQLKPGETSPEMTAESLGMLSNLMLAQAQYLFYKMATDNKMKADILSKIALQISVYFKKAYQLSQTNRALANFQNKSFANIMNYHDKYFEASAWLILAIDRFTVAKEKGKDMGLAAGTALRAYQLFSGIGSIVNSIPTEYAQTFQKKLDQSLNMKNMAEDKAKNVFFEIIVSYEKIQIPDSKNFVKFDASIKDELDKVPIMNETLRYIIPPQVRKMQAEFKQMLQNLIDQKYKEVEKSDLEQRAFLGQYHLPQSYYELTSVEDIPATYWSKIEEFQKKGAISNFANAIQSIKELGVNCQTMLQDAIKTLDREEQDDQNLRGTYGVQWALPASQGLNGPYRQNIQMYQSKLQIATAQDKTTENRFQQQKGELEILSKTKNELLEMMPVSQASTEIAQMPASIAIKNAIDNLDNAKKKRDQYLTDCVQDLANLNMVEKLLQVHQGQLSKDEVFNESKEHFNQYFKNMQDQEQLVKAANEVIKTTWSDFQNLKKSIQIDPTRQQFFQRIDLSLMCQQDLENMLHQGNEFYTRLVEHLTNLKQNIYDFKMSRNLQMQDQCKRLGVQSPNFHEVQGFQILSQPIDFEFEVYHPPS